MTVTELRRPYRACADASNVPPPIVLPVSRAAMERIARVIPEYADLLRPDFRPYAPPTWLDYPASSWVERAETDRFNLSDNAPVRLA